MGGWFHRESDSYHTWPVDMEEQEAPLSQASRRWNPIWVWANYEQYSEQARNDQPRRPPSQRPVHTWCRPWETHQYLSWWKTSMVDKLWNRHCSCWTQKEETGWKLRWWWRWQATSPPPSPSATISLYHPGWTTMEEPKMPEEHQKLEETQIPWQAWYRRLPIWWIWQRNSFYYSSG